jgi:diguanylate cyclase (GGDEF)-like protein/PAS domain S-box-containing protein
MYIAALDGKMVFLSPQAEQLFGYPRERWLGSADFFKQLLHEDDRERVLAELERAREREESFRSEYRMRAENGGVVWLLDEAVLVRDESGKPLHRQGYFLDVTERAEAAAALRAREESFRTLVSNIPGAIYRAAADADRTMKFVSDNIESVVGYPPSDLIDSRERTFASVLHPDDRQVVAGAIAAAIAAREPYVLEYRVRTADGGVRWVYEKGQGVWDEDGGLQWLDGAIFDVTSRKLAEEARARAEQELKLQAQLNRHQALHDALTGLPNRTLFGDRIEQAIRTARREGHQVAVLMMDLDRFKEVNDTLGHHSGDLLLKELGVRVQGALRDSDSVARLGGDEFGVLLPEYADRDSLLKVIDRIRSAIERPYVLDDLPLSVEASVGVALFPDHGDDVDLLVRRADVAMYVAKQWNSGYAVYDPQEDDFNPARLTLVGELRRALNERELILHYQPKAELVTGEVVSVEALIRWRHPERGMVPPDEFIPVAQQTGLIKPLTLYVLDEALRQCREWSRSGWELTVAVNVSMRNLIDLEFPEDVAKLLAKWKADPSGLELEITESTIVADPFRSKLVLERLSEMGLRLSIDDFGTGYTSLAYLKRLPVDEIKIDRTFVMNMITDEDDDAIVRSTIDLGRNLGLEVVAEGVESEEIWERLKKLGCNVAQGYYLSRPLEADDLAVWLSSLPSESGIVPPVPRSPESRTSASARRRAARAASAAPVRGPGRSHRAPGR